MQVEQIDRDAAAGLFRDKRTDLAVKFRLGANPEPLLEAFARHRIAERERVVAEICEFLRDYPAEQYKRDMAYTIAYRIEVEFGGRD